ncbi:hypothetical protein C1H76_3030 [Elsinoe australis]|uniref:Uncharacterized protein n=1 Tax=Elsinoe australis TaxID=40998 RepID=A0A4U7B564_9PEZI|nr:hypothetical protein C1H76_3030 [Elsinoe australis]
MTIQPPITKARYTTIIMPPSPPSSTSPPREVRFASTPTTQTTGSRTLDSTERTSVDHFEAHARHCRSCQDAYHRFKKGKVMCPTGAALAFDTRQHLFRWHSEIWAISSYQPGRGYVRVAMPSGYDHTDAALKLMEKHGSNAVFGEDGKALRKDQDRIHRDSKKKDKHRRHDTHSSTSSTQDAYAAANAFYPTAQYAVQNVSPPSSRGSSSESRRPRSSELAREYAARSDSVAATVGTRIPSPGTYETVTMRPAGHHRSHRRS